MSDPLLKQLALTEKKWLHFTLTSANFPENCELDATKVLAK